MCLVVFGRAKSAWLATAAVCANRYFSSGVSSYVSQNYLEVGGQDVSALKAFGNLVANLPGVILPTVGVFIRRQTGSLAAFYGLVACWCARAAFLAHCYFVAARRRSDGFLPAGPNSPDLLKATACGCVSGTLRPRRPARSS